MSKMVSAVRSKATGRVYESAGHRGKYTVLRDEMGTFEVLASKVEPLGQVDESQIDRIDEHPVAWTPPAVAGF